MIYTAEEVDELYKLPRHQGRIWQYVLYHVFDNITIANCKINDNWKNEKEEPKYSYYLMYSFNGRKWYNYKLHYDFHKKNLIYNKRNNAVILPVKRKDGTYVLIYTQDGKKWYEKDFKYNIYNMGKVIEYNTTLLFTCNYIKRNKQEFKEWIFYSMDGFNWFKAIINSKDKLKLTDFTEIKHEDKLFTCEADNILTEYKKIGNRTQHIKIASNDGFNWRIE